ncbi:RNA 3'-terminal phosphate cyclase [Candidatus Woesearchaeota archaeon]|nr:RNA 3'-terminal phosphate cyclase [Candidatus Woesearchaeota archaeon]
MISIDGSYLEGGGQIVRTALALSTLTGKPFKVTDIRKGRAKPGLKAQHLNAVNALQQLCDAKVPGRYLGSMELEYHPGKLGFHNLNIDIGTAGSITLLLQAVLPVVMFSDKKLILKITGGTDVQHSMPVDYFVNVLLPHLKKYADIEASIERRGYYPKGNGRLVLKIEPKYLISSFKTFDDFMASLQEDTSIGLDSQGKLLVIKGVSHASKDLMKANVAERQAKTAKYLLSSLAPVKINIEYVDALSIGSGITLWAIFSKGDEIDFINPIVMGADSLGEKGKKSEKVGEEAALRLKKQIESGKPVDKYLADQILPFLALSGGSIDVSEITDHCKTNMYVIEKFLDVKFKIEKNKITC